MEDAEKLKSLKTVTTVVYALQALGFFNGITWIAAVIISGASISNAKDASPMSRQRF